MNVLALLFLAAAFLYGIGRFIVGAIISPTTTDPTVRQRVGSVNAETSAGVPGVAGMKWVRARYDFAQDGGAVGAILLMGGTFLPSGAVILGGYVEVVTPPTSGGAATIALQIEAANDLVNAAAISGAPWSTAGRKSVIPAFTGATSLKTTAARDISAVVATAALTAGVFDVYVAYIETV